jgi:hypothetical protein
MNKDSASSALSSLWALILRASQELDYRHSDALADLVRQLKQGVDGDDYFNRRLHLLLDSLRTCGLLNQVPTKPKGASGLLDEIQALQKLLR